MRKCKGMKDLLPQDMVVFRRIEDAFRESCTRFGYQEVRTPTLEHLHCFTSTGTLTPQMLRSVYSFLDWDGWSGERIVLRPDGTIPLARLYVDSLGAPKGVSKFFYVENVFRFTDSAEEARERWQCGAELLGSSVPLADAELVVLATDVLERLCLGPVRLEISHAGILRHLLEELDLDPEEQDRVFDQVQVADLQSLALMERQHPRLGRFLPLLLDPKGQGSGFLRNLKASLVSEFPLLEASFDNFIQLADLLTLLGCTYEINFALPGGFEYYTGFMFQLFLNGAKLGGGGRYDELIPLVGGPSISSLGFALYLDRLMGLLASAGGRGTPVPRRVLVEAKEEAPTAVKRCFDLIRQLHEEGVIAELDLGQDRKAYSHVVSVEDASPNGICRVEARSTGKRFQIKGQDFQALVKALGVD